MEQEEGEEEEEKETKPDPLHQLILHFSRTALTEKRFADETHKMHRVSSRQHAPPPLAHHFSTPPRSKLDTDHLYMAYADIMAKVSESGSGDARQQPRS